MKLIWSLLVQQQVDAQIPESLEVPGLRVSVRGRDANVRRPRITLSKALARTMP